MRDGLAEKIQTITAQRENLQTVLASLRDAVIALDADGHVVLANRAARELLVAEGAEVEGRHLQTVIRSRAMIDAYNESAAAGRPVARQLEVDLKGRPRHLDVLVSPMAPGGKGPARLLVVRDVTDLVQTAAVKAEFVANASHELRTPLASLRAAADSLADIHPADHADLARLAAIIDRQVRRLENLTLDLLNLHVIESAKRPPALEPIAVRSLLDWLAAQFAARASDKGLALELAAPAPDDVFTADRLLLELILQNLLDNALKFTPAGGRVTCTLRRQDNALCLRVSDTGCGIAREDQARVFERFYRADASRARTDETRGTGLGLAIVRHATDRLGGAVTLESELGEGTTVTVLVPDGARP
jgi:two-component system phosphate regulon sensor histidine kinase PhoR